MLQLDLVNTARGAQGLPALEQMQAVAAAAARAQLQALLAVPQWQQANAAVQALMPQGP